MKQMIVLFIINLRTAVVVCFRGYLKSFSSHDYAPLAPQVWGKTEAN